MQTVRYDILGRVVETSNPTEINSGFGEAGDDATPGWKYTKQTYDWKGRPLVTTLQDNTSTRIASYSGCGCAGGEVVTLQDEGTTISSVLTRRKQKITKDVLGRTVKAETFEWDGASAYQTVVTTYNVLDQVIQARQYAGDDSSATYQDTTYGYDGYGRLNSSQAPSQTSNTTYTYYADDRLYRRGDGRGSHRDFTYNNRGLLTGISYASTDIGMTIPASVTLAYDGAGNRISMEDGEGSVSYEYDQCSRMTAETREFDATLSGAPSGGYKLAYTYHLNGSLASLTDPFDDEIDYAIDVAGRLTGVTGSSYGGITAYADSAEYRASNVLKHLEYGNGQVMDATFNARMAPASYQVTDGTHNVVSKEYDYYNTGQIRYAEDLLNAKFDRLYEFDKVGRIATAKSGAEARGSTDYLENIPYRQTYSYDSFNHLTGRTSNHWVASYGVSDTYTNDLNDNWTYDAAGNVLIATDQTNTLDAAQQTIQVEVTDDSRTMQKFDGIGQVVHQRAEHWNPISSTFLLDSDKYLIRSSVLGGAVVTELGATGGKARSFVYAGGTVIAWQTDGTYLGELVNWMHQEPAGATSRSTDSTGAVVISGLYGAGAEPGELDPVRANAGTVNPYIDPNIPPDDGSGASSQASTGFSNPWHMRGTYSVDGIRVEPETFMQMAEAAIKSPFNMIMLAAYRSANQFLYYQVHGANGENTFVSNKIGDKMLAVFGAIELHGTAQAVWLEGTWNLSFAPTSISTGSQNPSPQNAGVKAPLNSKDAKRYEEQRRAAVGGILLSIKCQEYLSTHEIDIPTLIAAILAQQPYDGLNSTLTRTEAGFTDPLNPVAANFGSNPVFLEFKRRKGEQASTQLWPGGKDVTTYTERSDVYYRSSGISAAVIIHEALHSLFGETDPQLQDRLGLTHSGITNNITQALIDHECAKK